MSEVRPGGSGSAAEVPQMHLRSVKHSFSLRSASALSFATMRPIFIFTVAGGVLLTAGSGAWLAVLLCYALLLLIASVLAELASHWPLEGSVYEWTRQLIGPRSGLIVGWAYLCSYVVFMAAIAYYAALKIFGLFDSSPNRVVAGILALVLILLATLINLAGRVYLKAVAVAAAAISLVGCLIFATVLLIGYRAESLGALFASPADGVHGWAWLSGPFLFVLVTLSVISMRGVELVAEVAEEVRDPERSVPKALVWSVVVAGAVVLYTSAALALAAPDALAGAQKFISLLVVLAYSGALVIFQMAASRTLWITTRDRVLPAHAYFGQLSKGDRLPVRAIIVVGIVAAILPFITSTSASQVLFGTAGAALLLAYLVPILGAARSRMRGTWAPGPWSLGGWGGIAVVLSIIALVGLVLNIIWPRADYYGDGITAWGPIIGLVVIIVLGLIISGWAFRDGGIHTRHFGHTDRDLQRIRLAHGSTCSLCLRTLSEGSEAQWDDSAHALTCIPCDEMTDWIRARPGATDAELSAVFIEAHESYSSIAPPTESTLRRIRAVR